jgi:hypothetical protein
MKNIRITDEIEDKPVGYDRFRANLCERPATAKPGTTESNEGHEPPTAKELGLTGRDAYVHGLVTASQRPAAAKPATNTTPGGR